MVRFRKYCYLKIILLALLFIGSQVRWAVAETPARLFILHSYDHNHVCGQPQHDGVLAALQAEGYSPGQKLDVQTYYMDTKHRNTTPALIERQAVIALDRIKAFRPDILVTLDDNAFKSVALRLVDTAIAIVFSGLNRQPEYYNQHVTFMMSREHPGYNITGVYERLHIANAIRVHARIFPYVQKALLLTDVSPTGNAIFQQMEIELSSEAIPIAWELKKIHTWEDYLEEIDAVNQDPLIGVVCPAVLLLKDNNGRTYTTPQIIEWTVAHLRKPEIALNDALVRKGFFGGAAVDFYAMGQQAGRKVVKILNGHRVGDIAIDDAQRYSLSFNLKRAQALNIDIPHEVILASDEIIRP